MERKETMSLGDAMRQFIEEADFTDRLDGLRAADTWPLIVGAHLASKSPRPTVKRGVMTVRIAEAPLRQELTLNRTRLRDALNRQLGKEIIKEIRFTS